jgi:ribosomal protein S18 acetylase RimI-like enzyme
MENASPSNPITIRRATIADADTLAMLGARLFEQTFGPANTAEDMRKYLSDSFSPAIQRDELADGRRAIWLAESGGSPVGYALLRRGSTSDGVVAQRPAEVQRIYVDQTLHGRGVGDLLMAHCVEQAQAWECDVIWLAVWQMNPRAIAFYEKTGFIRVGVKTFQLGADLQHDFVMARLL